MKCPHCNQEVPEGKEFCGFCGKPIQKKPAETKPPKPEGKRRVWLWVLIAVLLVALVVLGVIFVPRWLDQPSQPDTLSSLPTSTPPIVQLAQTAAPDQASEPLPVPEEVWLTLSGVEVQHQEAPLSIDDDTMHNAARQ
ncbi:MAG TPA: zinc ribbon domain-containing protein, partial [Anaerolineae bacterium]|nr:zinc ribbon domain-containing protein [Anaerolineae bacterium]